MSSATRNSKVAAPADLFAEKTTAKIMTVTVRLKMPLRSGGVGPQEWTIPRAAATPKLAAMITAGPSTAMSRPRPLRGLNPTPAQIARR